MSLKLRKFAKFVDKTFAFVDPDEAKHWVDDYYRILKEECVPIGHTINPNIAMVTSFGCHK